MDFLICRLEEKNWCPSPPGLSPLLDRLYSTPRFVLCLKESLVAISFCECTNVCVLREEFFADYGKLPKSLT